MQATQVRCANCGRTYPEPRWLDARGHCGECLEPRGSLLADEMRTSLGLQSLVVFLFVVAALVAVFGVSIILSTTRGGLNTIVGLLNTAWQALVLAGLGMLARVLLILERRTRPPPRPVPINTPPVSEPTPGPKP